MSNWSKKVFFFSLLCIALLLPNTPLSTAGGEIESETDSAVEDTSIVKLIPPRFVGEPVNLEFNLPRPFGKIVLRAVKGPSGEEGMEGIVTFPEKPIVIGPLTIDNKGTLSLVNGIMSFTGKASLELGGKKVEAKIGLRELIFDSKKDEETDATDNEARKRVRLVESCRFGIELVGEAKDLELVPGVPIAFKSFDLLLTSLSAPSLHMRGFLAKEPVDLIATLDLRNKTLSAKGSIRQCKLVELAPFLKNTILEDFSFGGKFSVSTAGDAHAEGHLYGKTVKDKASIEFFPGVSASFDSIIFDFKKGGTTSITAKTTFLGTSFEYIGSYNSKTKELALSAAMKRLKLVDMLPFISTSELKDIVFDAIAKISSKKSVSFKGSLSNEGKISFYGFTLKKIAVGLDTGKKAGFVMGKIDIVGLPASARFGLDWGAKAAIFASAGFDEDVDKWQPFLLLPKVDKKLDFLRNITIEKPKLRISAGVAKKDLSTKKKTSSKKKSEKKIEIIEDYIPRLAENEEADEDYLSIDELKEQGTHLSLEIGGGIKAGRLLGDATEQVWQIVQLDKRVLDGIAIKDIDAEGLFKIGLVKGGFNIVGFLSLPKGFALTDVLPSKEVFQKHVPGGGGGLLYEVLDFVKMDYGKLVVSLKDEEIDGVKYTKGISIDTNISIGKNFQDKLMNELNDPKLKSSIGLFFSQKGERGLGARFFLTFNPLSPKELILKIGVTTGDFTFTIPKISKPPVDIGPFDFSNLALDFVVRGTSVGVDVGFDFLPHEDENQQKITFAGGVKASENAIAGEVSAAGIWSNPFGIGKIFRGGFTIGDLGLFISETYENIGNAFSSFGASLLLGHIGLSGKTSLGKTNPLVLEGFLKIGGDVLDTAFEFRAKNIEKMADLLQGFAEQLGIASQMKIDLNQLMVGKIEEIYLKFAPFGSNIGNIKVAGGIGGAFHGELFGQKAGAFLEMSTTGISMRGYLPDIKIGPLVITKAGGKGKEIQDIIKEYFTTRAPSEIGPEFDFVLSLNQLPKLKINGEVRVDLPNNNVLFKSLTDIELSAQRFAFETDTQIGPEFAGLRAHIKGSTLDIGDPMKLLRQLQPDKLSLEMEFTNTLSKQILKAVDEGCEKLEVEVEKTLKQFIDQIDRATTDADVAAQEKLFKQAMKDVKIDNAIIEWVKWRYVAAKRDLEKLLDPTGNAREFMKTVGLNRLIQDIARGITDQITTVLKGGKVSFDWVAKAMVIEKIYWKGNVASLIKGKISGIEVDATIRDKKYHQNIGDLDFSDADKLRDSLAKISLNVAQIAAKFIGELLGLGIALPSCAPSVLVEFQNQREDLTISVKDASNIETIVPWRGQKNYVQADILCQKNPDKLQTGESADAANTYLLSVNGKIAARITCAYGPLGKEGITAKIEEATSDGKFIERLTQVNWGEKWVDIAPEGIAPFTLKVIITNDATIQNKIKFYIQEVFENCPAKVFVEGINQRSDLAVFVIDEFKKHVPVPHISKRAWIQVDGICRDQNTPKSKKYTVFVQDEKAADVFCTFGPAVDEYIKAKISKAPGIRGPADPPEITFRGAVGGNATQMILTLKNNTRFNLKIELVKELTNGIMQSKLKIYIQEIGACGAQAWVEVQNQIQQMPLRVEDSYGHSIDVPHVSQKAYVTLDPICVAKGDTVSENYKVFCGGALTAIIRCTFTENENTGFKGMSAEILDQNSNPLESFSRPSSEWIQGKEIKHTFPSDIEIKVMTIKELTNGVPQSKFKIYVSKQGEKANVEFQKTTDREITVSALSSDKIASVPKDPNYIIFDAIYRPSKVGTAAEKYYKISVGETPIAIVKCLFWQNESTGFAGMSAHIRAPNSSPTDSPLQDTGIAVSSSWAFGREIKHTFPSGIEIKVMTIKEGGQCKFKIYIGNYITCTENAVFEIQNQQARQGIQVVKLIPGGETIKVPWHGQWGPGFTTIDRLCKGTGADYQITVDGSPFACLRFIYTPDGKFAAHIRSANNQTRLRNSGIYQWFPVDPAKFEMKQNMGAYTVGFVALKQDGQDKLKTYFQNNEWGSSGGEVG